jgi:hypothetical protein
MKTLTHLTLSIFIAVGANLAIPDTFAGEQGGGARKPCKPPRCGKVTNASKNEVSIETLEIKPTETASGSQAQSGMPTQRPTPKLSNDEQFPGRTHKLSNDDFNPGPASHTRKLSNDEQFPGVKH